VVEEEANDVNDANLTLPPSLPSSLPLTSLLEASREESEELREEVPSIHIEVERPLTTPSLPLSLSPSLLSADLPPGSLQRRKRRATRGRRVFTHRDRRAKGRLGTDAGGGNYSSPAGREGEREGGREGGREVHIEIEGLRGALGQTQEEGSILRRQVRPFPPRRPPPSLFMGCGSRRQTANAKPPHILFIMIDDAGMQDVGYNAR